MQRFNACWVPGTDHAGIATQAVVERRIRDEDGRTRHDLGREEVVKRIWQWKDQYEARILGQLRQMGCSCDWQRTRFTLDPGLVLAVRQTFFNLFKGGLIVRGKRLVNWDTALQTAVADDEIFHETVKGGFWTFRYPIKDSSEFICFSTTRPETMLGDTAVAVHPNDDRYRHLIGKRAIVPLVGREIPIIGDPELVDPKLGTGAVKVTPAHDPNDYACGQRHGLPMINILNADGTLNENAGAYAGLDRLVARERVVGEMEKLGLFDGREDREIDLAHSDRSKTPIEPYLSDQWFVKMAGLAESAIDVVENQRVRFFPERYAKTYTDWLGEKRDWCISRQLWWGHRIPIWYVECPEAELKKAFQGRTVHWRRDPEHEQWLICSMEDLAPEALGARYKLRQDPDVLDTWFSSALWTHSTFGWPKSTPDLRYYYPTSVLVTSRDIITLWVARMAVSGLYNMHEVPFHHVYVHPKILDGFGETMSKSKGNGIDPLDIIDRYGADALRFGMAHVATETQDSRLPVSNVCPLCGTLVAVRREHLYMRTKKITCPSCKKPFRPGGPWPSEDPELPTARQASDRFELGRNFANKIWNAARFLLLNLDGYSTGKLNPEDLELEDRWIASRLTETCETVTADLEGYHFSDGARVIYEFIWSEFCDWYVEMAKGRLRDPARRLIAQRMLAGVLDAICRLVHPIMPFLAESIWQALGERARERGLPEPSQAAESIVIAPWPQFDPRWRDPDVERRVARMQDMIRAIREIRNRYGLDAARPLDVTVRCSKETVKQLGSLSTFVHELAGVGNLDIGPDVQKPGQAASHHHADFELYVSLSGLVDIAKEIERLEKQRAEMRKHLEGSEKKLLNKDFTDRAPAEVVEQQRALVEDLKRQIEAMEGTLAELKS
jgi:valyl-tRNA synthetase